MSADNRFVNQESGSPVGVTANYGALDSSPDGAIQQGGIQVVGASQYSQEPWRQPSFGNLPLTQPPDGVIKQYVPPKQADTDTTPKPTPTPPKAVDLVSGKPSSPCVLFSRDNQVHGLPLIRMAVTAEFHISTAFVNITATFINSGKRPVPGAMLVVPLNGGTVTNAQVRIGSGRLVETAVIDADDAQDITKQNTKATKADKSIDALNQHMPLDEYTPDLFRLPLANIARGDHVTVSINYMEALEFRRAMYNFDLRLTLPQSILPLNRTAADLVTVRASINSIVPNIRFCSDTHQCQITGAQNLRTELLCTPKAADGNTDFHVGYSAASETITAALLMEPPVQTRDSDGMGAFCMFVNPPTPESNKGSMCRDFIFLLDRSGSMYGEPFSEAVRGLEHAFQSLVQGDRFNVVCFDHEQVVWEPNNALIDYTPDNAQRAVAFLHGVAPRGGTDIATPLFTAIAQLKSASAASPNRLALVVVITDGCVANEKEICLRMQTECGNVRVLTFAIGTYCNWYFLKMLAMASRGFDRGSVYKESLCHNIQVLMEQAGQPVLTDINIGLHGVAGLELYPFPIPDLYMGQPLCVAGRFQGASFPPSALLVGRLPNGEQWQCEVRTDRSQVVPVKKVFLKQRLDMLTSRQWLTDEEALKQQIIRTSVEDSFPSRFTTMVGYETTPDKKREELARTERDSQKGAKKKNSKGKVAAIAVGGVFVIGAAAYMMGNLGASLGNASGLMGGGGLGFPDFGECCCDGCPCFDSCDGLLETFTCGGCDSCDGLFETLTCGGCDACGSIDCGGCCAGIGDCFGSIGDVLGDCFGGFGDACGDCFGSIGGGCGSCADVLGDCDCGDLDNCL